jgi:hypothetical protein
MRTAAASPGPAHAGTRRSGDQWLLGSVAQNGKEKNRPARFGSVRPPGHRAASKISSFFLFLIYIYFQSHLN